ncbi:hypothetical protein SDC9_140268 [bioreactor metagenome]|uniref:Uncharacterized protein n=1 Tax=bioreactor metagenome TaxID=1076179 RepID=A0A645DXS4_9ZZZZ
MPHDDIFDAKGPEHLPGNLSGVGAGGLVMEVLGADGDFAVLKALEGHGNVHKGDAQHHAAPFPLGEDGLELLCKGPDLARGLVHLPVSCDDGLAVSHIHEAKLLLFRYEPS